MVKTIHEYVKWLPRIAIAILFAVSLLTISSVVPQGAGYSTQAMAQSAEKKKAKKKKKKKKAKKANDGKKKKAKKTNGKRKAKKGGKSGKSKKAERKAKKKKAKRKSKNRAVDRRNDPSIPRGGFGGGAPRKADADRRNVNPIPRGGFGPGARTPPRSADLPSLKKKRAAKKRRAKRNLKAVRAKRKRRKVGNRIRIDEPDGRAIFKSKGRTIIRNRNRGRIGRGARNKRRAARRRGGYTETITRANGTRVVSVFGRNGQLLRRTRIGRGGRRSVLFNNRRHHRRGHARDHDDFPVFLAIAAPIVAIAATAYIVESNRVGYNGIYDTLRAPPVDRIEPRYTLDEVRYNRNLRDRMRRVDVNTINFDFGSWYVSDSQFHELQDIARAMRKILRDNPDEVFMIEGHTDAVGDFEDNLSLSDRRAESVAIVLTEEFDIPPENLTTQGYGEEYLKIRTSRAERRNRRVSIRRITPLLARNDDALDDDYYDVD